MQVRARASLAYFILPKESNPFILIGDLSIEQDEEAPTACFTSISNHIVMTIHIPFLAIWDYTCNVKK